LRPDDRLRVIHMIEACEELERFISGRVPKDLEIDRMLLFAVVRALEVLGEAGAGVTPETRLLAPDIPWTLIVATRNRLIHGYFDIDSEIVWTTASEEVPMLVPLLINLRDKLS